MLSPLLLFFLVVVIVVVSFSSLSVASLGKVGVTYNAESGLNSKRNCSMPKFLRDHGATRLRIRQPTTVDVKKFYDTGISISIAITSNLDITLLANSSYSARTWLIDQGITSDSAKRVTISDISLGYNVTTTEENFYFSQVNDTLNAMSNLRAALDAAGLRGVNVTTEHTFGIILNPFPPTSAEFNPLLVANLKRQLDVLGRWRSPFQVELHPYRYFSTGNYSFQFALFEVDRDGPSARLDRKSGLLYGNAFEMMVDSVMVALTKLGHGGMEVEVVGTGWPEVSQTADMLEATGLNAAEYYTRLVWWVVKGSGTPLRPRWSPRTYLRSLVDDNANSRDQPYKTNMGIASLDGSNFLLPRFDIRFDGNYQW